jgi:hypothetical protein
MENKINRVSFLSMFFSPKYYMLMRLPEKFLAQYDKNDHQSVIKESLIIGSMKICIINR